MVHSTKYLEYPMSFLKFKNILQAKFLDARNNYNFLTVLETNTLAGQIIINNFFKQISVIGSPIVMVKLFKVKHFNLFF